jgi:hypothetical protein
VKPVAPKPAAAEPVAAEEARSAGALAPSATATATATVRYDATSIRVLGGVEAVRKRPAMYIGDTGMRGLHHLVEEVVDNSIDEAMAGRCENIDVRLNADGSVSVADDGAGIPVEMHREQKKSALEVVMTMLHAGGKFDSQVYQAAGGLHGVGVSVVNALSEWLEAEVRRDGHTYRQEYARGKPKGPVATLGKATHTGTRVTFKPDGEIFPDTTFSYQVVARRLRELAFLNPGVRISVSEEATGRTEAFRYAGGLAEFAGVQPLVDDADGNEQRAGRDAVVDHHQQRAFNARERHRLDITLVIELPPAGNDQRPKDRPGGALSRLRCSLFSARLSRHQQQGNQNRRRRS